MCYHVSMHLFIFDMGNVFLSDIAVLDGMSRILSIPECDLQSDYSALEHALMDGSMKVWDYYRHLEDKFGVTITGDIYADCFNPEVNTGLIDLVDEFRRQGIRCVVGSNTSDPHWKKIHRMEEKPLEHFDALYASHLMGVAKPDPAFWAHILREEKAEPQDTLFIDDLDENCRGAGSLGITTFRFSGEKAVDRLRSFAEELVR